MTSTLFDPTALDATPADAAPTLAQRFWQFHTRHPDVLADLVEMVREVAEHQAAQGRIRPTSIRDCLGAMRHNHLAHGPDDDGFSLNNSYAAFYARKVIEVEPRLAPWINTRNSIADQEPSA